MELTPTELSKNLHPTGLEVGSYKPEAATNQTATLIEQTKLCHKPEAATNQTATLIEQTKLCHKISPSDSKFIFFTGSLSFHLLNKSLHS
ncbi:hypothetical protein [Pseudoalteromonas sp. TAE56]|jgi:hypothetical protein|uniref:hypothetical protein n=1 Tax=Pseudoalteromonas sp. TAE56 TaxID=1938596 RepID=UPI00046729DD|nr:hypothetical protein [Pseudoalteromonas sp. TAE56]